MIYALASYLEPLLVLTVLIVMACRKLFSQFPFFFTYLTVVVAADVIRLVLFRMRLPLPYFYAYWVTEALEILLSFLVLYEVFLIRLFPGFKMTVIYRWLFPVIGLIVIALTAWMFFGAPSQGPSKIVAFIGASTLALSFCQVAFLTFFGGLMLWMSREWERHELGIAVGFGVYGAAKLFVTLERAKRVYAPIRLEQIHNVAYLVAIAIWLFYLSRSDPKPAETPITEEMVEQAEQAYGDVLQLFQKKPKN